MDPPRSLFMALPTETRQNIYRMLLQRAWPIERKFFGKRFGFSNPPNTGPWTSNTAILALSKQVSDEALGVLYGENTFVITLRFWHHDPNMNFPEFFVDFNQANMLRVRSISFQLEMTDLIPYVQVTHLIPVPCVAKLLERLTYLRVVVLNDSSCMGMGGGPHGESYEPEGGYGPYKPVTNPYLDAILEGPHASKQLEKLGDALDGFYHMYKKERGFEVFTQSEKLAKYLNWTIPAIEDEEESALAQEEKRYTNKHHPKGRLVLREPRSVIERGPYCNGRRTWRIWSRKVEGSQDEKREGGRKAGKGVASLYWT